MTSFCGEVILVAANVKALEPDSLGSNPGCAAY